MIKLAELIEENADKIAAIESLDNGMTFKDARVIHVPDAAAVFRYAYKLRGLRCSTNLIL